MSLQAIAGVAYDRRNPQSPSNVTRARMAAAGASAGGGPGLPDDQGASSAKQFNSALEALKRYIPTEFLALYLPFLAISKDRGADAQDWAIYIYLGFVIATPIAVALIYLAKAAEASHDVPRPPLPKFEMFLATIAFAIWGASVPSMFPGNQWWLAMLAMASAFALPLIDTAFGN